MAPPPFKVVGPIPKPLTIQETADALRVSRLQVDEVLAAVAAVIDEGGSTRPKGVGATRKRFAAKPAKSAKAAKPASSTKTGKFRRRTRSAGKAVAGSRR